MMLAWRLLIMLMLVGGNGAIVSSSAHPRRQITLARIIHWPQV